MKRKIKLVVQITALALGVLPESAGYEAIQELAETVISDEPKTAVETLTYAKSIAEGYEEFYG